jgi:hypothetical protein
MSKIGKASTVMLRLYALHPARSQPLTGLLASFGLATRRANLVF